MVLDIQVIFVTKNWRLVKKAAIELLQLDSTVSVGRIGGDADKLPYSGVKVNEKFNGVAFTTLHTLYLLLKNKDCFLTTTLLVWDENHWGQRSKMGCKILEFCKKNNISILGLTATPLENDAFHVVFYRSFPDLVNAGWLARPIIEEPVTTGVEWSPGLNASGDFTAMSLRQLAVNANRNNLIAGYYNTHSNRFGQTLVFACNIEHANLLTRIFTQFGVTVAPIHGDVREEQQNQFMQDFQDGIIRVLISVEMLTHGIDLPTVKTIFLCRPTTSDILFTQMIGRGTRTQKGKSDFYIVEFTDNIKIHSDVMINAKRHFKGASGLDISDEKVARQSNGRNQHHEFDPSGLPMWIPDDSSLPASIRGLWLRRGQTFGVEFELMCPGMPEIEPSDPGWWCIATEILNTISSATEFVAEEPIGGYSGVESGFLKDCTVWNVEYDSTAGFEVTTRILSGIDGYLEVDRVCEALDKVIPSLGLDVNYETATHVHFGWNSQAPEELRRLVRLVRLAESGLGTLVAPSRLADFDGQNYNLKKPNSYCKPLSYIASEADITSWKSLKQVEEAFSDRYVTVNLKSLFKQGTVEVRMHSATIEARKILLWISFWQQLFWAASVDRVIPATEDHYIIQPDGDIVEFARTYLPSDNEPLQAAFLRHLDNRRREILEIWRQSSILSAWTKFRVNWKAVA